MSPYAPLCRSKNLPDPDFLNASHALFLLPQKHREYQENSGLVLGKAYMGMGFVSVAIDVRKTQIGCY